MPKPIRPTYKTSVIELQEMPTGGGSDATLKTDIREIHSAMALLLRLRPTTWHWKSDKKRQRREYGFIAQEVEQVLPWLVSDQTWEDGSKRKFLSTKEMIPLLVRAVQEQQKQIDDLSEQVEMLSKSRRD